MHSAASDSMHLHQQAYRRLSMCMQVKGMAEKLGVQINWLGRRDHLDPMLQDYQASCLPW